MSSPPTSRAQNACQLYMGVAADCAYVSIYGNKQNATTQILTTWNSASSLYKVCLCRYKYRRLGTTHSCISLRAPSTSVSVSRRFRLEILCKRTGVPSWKWIDLIQINSCPSTPDPNFPWNVPCSSAELDARLSLFSKWRGDKGSDGIGLWHLVSGCPTGSEVGIAWLGTL